MVIYPETLTSPFNADLSHITSNIEKFAKKIRSYSRDLQPVKAIEAVFDNPNNLPVRKSNMRSDYSEVYIGNGQTKTVLDSKLFPTLAYHASDKMIEIVNENPLPFKKEGLHNTLKGDLINFQISMEATIQNEANEDDKKVEKVVTRDLQLMAHNYYKGICGNPQEAEAEAETD